MPRRTRAVRRRSLVFPMLLVAGLLLGGTALAIVAPGLDLGGNRIPEVAVWAYQSAAREAPHIRAGCQVDWRILAAIGKVESDHGRSGSMPRTVTADGTISPPIIGPPLDGTAGTRSIRDTDKGKLDGDKRWDHAVGPMQFIPSTWRELGRDGNGDGVKDPNNLFDASLTAVSHLCLREPGDYQQRSQLRRSLIAYNRSAGYADRVLAWVDRYRSTPANELATPGF